MTVSTKPDGIRRGGATGNDMKIASPIAPEMNIAFRSKVYAVRWRRYNQKSVSPMTGQCPQMYIQLAAVTSTSLWRMSP